jgi:hypothetical protein
MRLVIALVIGLLAWPARAEGPIDLEPPKKLARRHHPPVEVTGQVLTGVGSAAILAGWALFIASALGTGPLFCFDSPCQTTAQRTLSDRLDGSGGALLAIGGAELVAGIPMWVVAARKRSVVRLVPGPTGLSGQF